MLSLSRDRIRRPVAVAALAVLLAGCGDGEPGAEPSPSAPSPTESSSSPSPSESATTPATPEVEPATGPEVRTERFSFRAPEGWKVTSDTLPFVKLARTPGNQVRLREPHGLIAVTILPSARRFTLDEVARRSDAEGRRLDDIQLDGEPAYHFSAPGDLDSNETFGLWREPFEVVSIDVGLFGSTQRKREDLATSVLATWEWLS